MRASNRLGVEATLSPLIFLALLALLASLQPAIADKATGYDISLSFGSPEETLEAARYYDREGSGFSVSHVHETALSMYTTSSSLANSFNKRSHGATVKVSDGRSHFRGNVFLGLSNQTLQFSGPLLTI